MHAMVLSAPCAPLRFEPREDPVPGPGDVRVKVAACGVCRTDLHVVDGELPDIAYPIVPGHEVVGRVDALGPGVTSLRIGERVGVPWLGYTCGECSYCRAARIISVTVLALPATRATAALLRISSQMPVIAFRSARPATMSPSRLCYAPA